MPSIHPGPAYRILTPRLVIRCWDPADAMMMKTAIDESIEHLRPWMPWARHEPQDIQEKIELIRRFRGNFDLGNDFVYGVFDREETHVVGGTGLHTRAGEQAREIGYWIRLSDIRQGYATEISAALTRVAFEIDAVRRVEIHCAVDNLASAAVPRKLGFTHEATLRQRSLEEDGSYHDHMIWSLLRDEFPHSPAGHIDIKAFDAANRLIFSPAA